MVELVMEARSGVKFRWAECHVDVWTAVRPLGVSKRTERLCDGPEKTMVSLSWILLDLSVSR
jgi:hypothetical protein